MAISVHIPPDNEGFIAFRCPFCRGNFKLRATDLQQFEAPELGCAQCGLRADLQEFWPPEVIEAAMARVTNAVLEQVYEEFGKLEQSMRGGPVSFTRGSRTEVDEPKIRVVTDLATATVACCETVLKVPFFLAVSLFYCPYCRQVQA